MGSIKDELGYADKILMKYKWGGASSQRLILFISCLFIIFSFHQCQGKKEETTVSAISAVPSVTSVDLASLPKEPERLTAIERIIEEVQRHPR